MPSRQPAGRRRYVAVRYLEPWVTVVRGLFMRRLSPPPYLQNALISPLIANKWHSMASRKPCLLTPVRSLRLFNNLALSELKNDGAGRQGNKSANRPLGLRHKMRCAPIGRQRSGILFAGRGAARNQPALLPRGIRLCPPAGSNQPSPATSFESTARDPKTRASDGAPSAKLQPEECRAAPQPTRSRSRPSQMRAE